MERVKPIKHKLITMGVLGTVVTLAAVIAAMLLSKVTLVSGLNKDLQKFIDSETSHIADEVWSQCHITDLNPVPDTAALFTEIRKIKVGEKGYVYVIDTLGNFVVHPSYAGQNKLDLKNDDGVSIMQEMIDLAKKKGDNVHGYYEYMWRNKDETKARKKIAAVEYYAKRGWVIGVGAYEDEFLEAVAEIRERIDIFIFIVLVIGTVTTLISVLQVSKFGIRLGTMIGTVNDLLGRMSRGRTEITGNEESVLLQASSSGITELKSMVESIRQFNTYFSEKLSDIALLANRNFTRKGKTVLDDPLSRDIEELRNSLNISLAQIREATQEVNSNFYEISRASSLLSDGASSQAASVEEISASIVEVNGQAKTTASTAEKVNEITQFALEVSNRSDSSMAEMREAMNRIAAAGKKVESVMKLIDGIAFQTNLLALNAAVEAARAGAHGKGFAVVADEVRNLASRSAKAVGETSEMLELSQKEINHGIEVTTKVGADLAELSRQITEVSQHAGVIADAAVYQANAVEEISKGLAVVDTVTQQNSATAEETASASRVVESLAQSLLELVQVYTLDENGSEPQFREPQNVKRLSMR